jgi:hypothetical protein
MRHDVLQRLKVLRAEIESAQRDAYAERAYSTTDAASNPWAGSAQKCDELNNERRELELEIEGEAVKARLEKLRTLDSEIAKAMEARVDADRAVAEFAKSEAVIRWQKAGSIARAVGVAYDFETAFSKWYLSGKAKFAGAPQCTNYFMQDAPPPLRFTEADRPHVIRWHQARGESQSALIHWDALAQSRALLLRENPELASVA